MNLRACLCLLVVGCGNVPTVVSSGPSPSGGSTASSAGGGEQSSGGGGDSSGGGEASTGGGVVASGGGDSNSGGGEAVIGGGTSGTVGGGSNGGAGGGLGTGGGVSANIDAGVPLAFVGAEGFGARSRGGRGGDVYHVTNLNDTGTGSLRTGINSATGPRTIVFDLSGTIRLNSRLVINKPFITIAGQTAPGDGIALRDYSLDIAGTHDIVIRFIRVRRGDVIVRQSPRPTGSIGLDAVSIDDSSDVILDHVSLSWSCDELFGIVQNKNVTVQWSLLAEPLGDPPIHPYGDQHAFGLNVSASTFSLHHNLLANYVMRGPQFEANDAFNAQGYQVSMEAVNNVWFDYKASGSRYTAGIETSPGAASAIAFRFHYVNNRYIRSATHTTAPDIQAELKHGTSNQVKVYVAGNLGPSRPNTTLSPWASVVTSDGDPILQAPQSVKNQMSNTPLFVTPVPVTVQSVTNATADVLAKSGASLVRDSVDRRIVSDVTNQTFRAFLATVPASGWPMLVSKSAPLDSDGDGMSNAWEMQMGLNPTNATDRNGDADFDGYSNLEEYLEFRAQNPI
jgi:hypothetical protein